MIGKFRISAARRQDFERSLLGREMGAMWMPSLRLECLVSIRYDTFVVQNIGNGEVAGRISRDTDLRALSRAGKAAFEDR